MKLKTIVWSAWLLGVAMFLTGCGKEEITQNDTHQKMENFQDFQEETVEENENVVSEEMDYEKFYSGVLDDYLKLICNGEEDSFEGSVGVSEALMWMDEREALANIGYTIRDISGDGIPELLIGEYSEEKTEFGTMIYALYNGVNHEPECTFEGWYRNAYHWMGGKNFTYTGSGGAAYSMFGTVKLSEDGTALEWQEYYFTHEKGEDYAEIGCYYNTTGIDNPVDSEELDISLEEFWRIEEKLLKQRQWIPMTPFSEIAEIEIPNEISQDLKKVRERIMDNNDICAVGYLGFFDGNYEGLKDYFSDMGILEEYDFLADVDKEHFIDQEGYELYLVVTENENSGLIVNEYLMNEYEPVETGPGSELGRFYDGQPVILRGNISEILPNLYLETENPDGTFIAYTPSLSLRDGSLYSIDGICDITPYELLGIELSQD